MLYPQRNKYRHLVDLSGFWDFRFDPDDKGMGGNWTNGFNNRCPIAVPASWNDQFADYRDFLGPAWYQLEFTMPWEWDKKKIMIRQSIHRRIDKERKKPSKCYNVELSKRTP